MIEKVPISLVVLDGDDTLWYGLDGGFISGVTYQDEGRDDFTFRRFEGDLIVRSDGQRFVLYPEVRQVLEELKQKGTLISLASYNCPSPMSEALKAFGIHQYFKHPQVEWSGHKDRMILRILDAFQREGYLVRPENTLFVDDDLYGRYRPQMNRIGVPFLQRGVDIHDLSEILNHPRYEIVAAKKRDSSTLDKEEQSF